MWLWATKGRFSGFSLPVDGPSVAVPGLDGRVSRRGGFAGGGDVWDVWVELAMDGHQNNKGQWGR